MLISKTGIVAAATSAAVLAALAVGVPTAINMSVVPQSAEVVAGVVPAPDVPTYRSHGHGPTFRHPGNWHHPSNMAVQVQGRGCKIVNRGGVDVSIKTTGVLPGPGEVVTKVQSGDVDPAGNVYKASKWGVKVGPATWLGALHLPPSTRRGIHKAYSAAYLTGTDSNAVRYAETDYCVQAYAWSSMISFTDDTPYVGQRITVSGAFMGLTTNGKAYKAMPHRWIKLYWRPTSTGAWSPVDTIQTGTDGRWNKRVKYTEPGDFAVTYAGSSDYAPFASNAVDIG